MHAGRLVAALACAVGGVGGHATLAAQGGTLHEAAERVRTAWLAHDAPGIVGQSPGLLLQIPGADPSSPLGRAQAANLLRRHLQAAEELGLELRAVRSVEPGSGVVEVERRYAVAGTRDIRRETWYWGFRLEGGRWVLTEVRSAT